MFLLKPHVTGPEGQITSPDVIVDAMFLDGTRSALGLLTHDGWQETDGNLTARAGYGVMALGGGALILPVLALSHGLVVAARSAWRLNNLDKHIEKVALNGTALADVGLPSAMITAHGGDGDTLPRGYLLIKTAEGKTTEATLSDPVMDRRLTHRLHLEPQSEDRWGDTRPRPRYSVGPTQKDVPHFI